MTDMALAYDLEASDEPRFSNSLRFPMEAIPWRPLISMMCRVWFVQDSASGFSLAQLARSREAHNEI